MKNTVLILCILSILSCKSQTPIIDVYGFEDFGTIENAYYKDSTNFHDQYVGTWLYTNGTTSLKIVFMKKTMFYTTESPKNFYADYLIGEYHYFENGIEKINTLANLDTNHTNINNYNLVSIGPVWKSIYPKCLECAPDEKRLSMDFDEPSRRNIVGGIGNDFFIRRVTENGSVKLKIQFAYHSDGAFYTSTGQAVTVTGFTIPFGDYTLIKQ
jgi:hypothetical protein